jgi:hypothetical protein
VMIPPVESDPGAHMGMDTSVLSFTRKRIRAALLGAFLVCREKKLRGSHPRLLRFKDFVVTPAMSRYVVHSISMPGVRCTHWVARSSYIGPGTPVHFWYDQTS